MNRQLMDPMVAEWLQEGPERGPREGLQRALDSTRTISQRPAWAFPRRWLPRPLAEAQLALPVPAALALILLLTMLLLIGLAAVVATRPPPIMLPIVPSAATMIAYQQGDAVYASLADGSAQVRLSSGVEYARSPTFSPDGRLVAFTAPSTPEALGGRLLVAPVDGSASPIDVSGGLEVLPSEVSQISWAPAGDRLAFAAEQDGVATIFVAAADGSAMTAVSDGSADRDVPSWSPDGEWIAHRTTDPDGVRVYLDKVRPDGSESQRINAVVAEDGHLSRLHWSPVPLAGSGTPMYNQAYAMNVGFGTQTVALIDQGFGHNDTAWTEGIGGYLDAGPSWSPDGLQLAILTADDGLVIADYKLTAETDSLVGDVRRVGDVVDCWVEWSPDGRAVYGGAPGDCTSVVVVPLADPDAAATLPVADLSIWQAKVP